MQPPEIACLSPFEEAGAGCQRTFLIGEVATASDNCVDPVVPTMVTPLADLPLGTTFATVSATDSITLATAVCPVTVVDTTVRLRLLFCLLFGRSFIGRQRWLREHH